MKKKVRFLVMFLLLIVTFTTAIPVKAKEETASTEDNLNLDVIYVIDGSGSMERADPKYMAPEAGKLFTELCASSAEGSRAGFVYYSHVLLQSVGLTDLSKGKDALQKNLEEIKYDINNDTDIALGLTEAVKLLKEGNSFNSGRNPMIVLLSDGRTDLPKGPRTVAESQKELDSTVKEAVSLNLPVYTIGLNYDGSLDSGTMSTIASMTGGKFYETTSSSQLNEIVADIFNDHTKGGSEELPSSYDSKTGRYTTNFTVDNASIYAANIVILTEKGVSDPKIIDPSGKEVPQDEKHNISVAKDKRYMTIKVKNPQKGDWSVSVAGDAEDSIKINLLTTFDMNLTLDIGSSSPKTGDDITLTALLKCGDQTITDDDLLYGATGTCIIKKAGEKKAQKIPMDADSYRFKYTMKAEKPGDYTIKAVLKGRDNSFSKETKTYKMIIKSIPLSIKSGDVKKVSIFGKPFGKEKDLSLEELTTYDKTAKIDCEIENENETNAQVSYDPDTKTFHIVPLKNGSQDVNVRIADNYGQSARFVLQVNVKSVWSVVLAVLAIILIIVVAIFFIIKALKPKFRDSITMQLTLPPALQSLTPGSVSMTLPGKKSEVLLGTVINEDQVARNTYNEVFMRTGLQALVQNIKLKALKDGIEVCVLPKTTGMIQIDNQKIDTEKGVKKSVRKGDRISIQYVSPSEQGGSVLTLIVGKEQKMSGSIYGSGGSDFDISHTGSPYGGQRGNGFGGGNGFGSGNGFGDGNGFGSGNGFGGGNSQGGNGFGSGNGFGGGNDFGGGNSQGGNGFGSGNGFGNGNDFGGGNSQGGNNFGSGNGFGSGNDFGGGNGQEGNGFGGGNNQGGNDFGSGSFGGDSQGNTQPGGNGGFNFGGSGSDGSGDDFF